MLTNLKQQSSLLLLVLVVTSWQDIQAAPAVCPGDATIVGYSNWQILQDDLDNFALTATPVPEGQVVVEPQVFTLCPGTNFTVSTTNSNRDGNTDTGNSPLYIFWQSDLPPVKLQCGLDGKSANKCVIQGGLHHVWIDKVSAIHFQGITFENAQRGSVWTGIGQDNVSFEDCIWRGNKYLWTSTNENVCPTGCAAAVGGQHGAASFTNCHFVDNEGYSGAVYGNNMQYTFERCVFERNVATLRSVSDQPTGSAITLVAPSSSLSLDNCCFIDNQSFGAATVSVDNSVIAVANARVADTAAPTAVVVNENNYFANNFVAVPMWDSQYEYCHNAIYTFMDNGMDDTCTTGTSECCRAYYTPAELAKDDACPEVSRDVFGDNTNETAWEDESSAFVLLSRIHPWMMLIFTMIVGGIAL